MFNLETEALVASGLKHHNAIKRYSSDLDMLFQRHLPTDVLVHSPLDNARRLFDALWRNRPERYRRKGPFRLNRVIDAQLSENRPPVGNCLGLTVFYNCLLKRLGIRVQALYIENAFDLGPHVLTLIPCGNMTIDVENIRSDGFDFQGHKGNPSRVEWGEEELVADIYASAGTESFYQGKFQRALQQYDQALKLNPHYEKASLNKAILLDRMERGPIQS